MPTRLPRPARRWRWSSRPRANWRCRCRRELDLALSPPPARASSPASAAWTRVAERRLLSQGAHIVVGTPGRLRDHLERGNLDLPRCAPSCSTRPTRCSTSASARISSSSSTPTPAERRTLMFSATVPRDIAALAKRYQRDALRIEVAGRRRPARRHRVPRRAWSPRTRSSTRSSTCCASTRPAQRHGVLRDARHRDAICTATCRSAASRSWRCRANSRRPSAPRRCRRCATAAPASASRPTSPRAASTCPTSTWSSTPTCRAIRETLLHRSGRTGRAGRKGISVLLVPHTRRGLAQRLLSARRG